MKRLFAMFMALALTALVPLSAQASGGHDLNGAELSILWVVPFVCMLLSIAISPLAVPHFWHHHFGKVALFWGLAFLVPCAMVFGLQLAVYQFVHVLFMEYVPFIILLFALFTIAGGVRLKGQLVGTPVVNAGLLALGTILASWMGTTGAAMLLIRPLLRANEHRKYRMHIVVFFIFLVANIGGSLTPLGDRRCSSASSRACPSSGRPCICSAKPCCFPSSCSASSSFWIRSCSARKASPNRHPVQ